MLAQNTQTVKTPKRRAGHSRPYSYQQAVGPGKRGTLQRRVLASSPRGPPAALGPLRLLLCTFHLQQWLRVGNGDEALENAQVAVTYEKPDRRGAYIGEWVKGSRLSPELPPPET